MTKLTKVKQNIHEHKDKSCNIFMHAVQRKVALAEWLSG